MPPRIKRQREPGLMERLGKDREGGMFHPRGAVIREFMPIENKTRSLQMDPDVFMGMRGREQVLPDTRARPVSDVVSQPRIIGKTKSGRPIVLNDDGTVSTEFSITVRHPELNAGQFTNIPSMFGGVRLDEDQAIERILRSGGVDPETGRSLPGFATMEDAIGGAKSRSLELGKELEPILRKLQRAKGRVKSRNRR